MSMPGFRSLLAVLGAGFEPAGIVMGAGAFQIFRPTMCWGLARKTSTESLVFGPYEQAVRNAWHDVIARLEAEAVGVGAHGVVGVSLRQELSTSGSTTAGAQEVLQLQLVGTAVRVRSAAPLPRPFLSTLSMDETLKLLLRGWIPSGIAVGISAVHVHGWAASAFMQGTTFSNAEMRAPTAGMALARARAEHEVRRALYATRAEGMVATALQLDRSEQACGDGKGVLIEGRIIGSGVVRYRDPVAAVSGIRNLSPAR